MARRWAASFFSPLQWTSPCQPGASAPGSLRPRLSLRPQHHRSPQVDPEAVAGAGDADEGIVAAGAAENGAHLHGVNGEVRDWPGCVATAADAFRGRDIEGEDVAEQTGGGIAIEVKIGIAHHAPP